MAIDRANSYTGLDTGDAFMWVFSVFTTAGTAAIVSYSLFNAFPLASGSTVYDLSHDYNTQDSKLGLRCAF